MNLIRSRSRSYNKANTVRTFPRIRVVRRSVDGPVERRKTKRAHVSTGNTRLLRVQRNLFPLRWTVIHFQAECPVLLASKRTTLETKNQLSDFLVKHSLRHQLRLASTADASQNYSAVRGCWLLHMRCLQQY